MTKFHATIAIRWALTAALIFGVYTETGKWTAISLALVMIAIEMMLLVPLATTRPKPGIYAGFIEAERASKAHAEIEKLLRKLVNRP